MFLLRIQLGRVLAEGHEGAAAHLLSNTLIPHRLLADLLWLDVATARVVKQGGLVLVVPINVEYEPFLSARLLSEFSNLNLVLFHLGD